MFYKVRLADDTVGTLDTDTLEGQSPCNFIDEIVEVVLYDENGNTIYKRGLLVEIF